MTRTRRRRWHAIALLAGREVFRKHSENSVHQKVREECPLLVRLGTLIHPNHMPAQGREPSMALVGMLACRNGRRVAASRSERMGSDP